MLTKQRTLMAPADATPTKHFTCSLGDTGQHFGVPVPDSGVGNVDFFYRPYSLLFEEQTPNSGPRKTRHEFKAFEHYKVGRARSSSSVRGVLTTQTWSFYPHEFTLKEFHPRFGCEGYDGSSNSYYAPFGEPGFPIQGLPHLYEKRADGGFVPPPSNLDELTSMALRSMMPTIKAELSAINSIIELKDFKSLPRTINHVFDTANKFKLIKSKLTLRDALRAKSDGYLQAKFNLLPLLADISGVKTAIVRVERQMNDLVTRSRKVQNRHFVYNWTEYPDISNESSLGYFAYPQVPFGYNQTTACAMHRDVRYASSVFHAQIQYTFTYTAYQREHALVLGLLDSLGINLNPQIIWNAIPWSFVVDWLLGVGRWLKDHTSRLNMEPKVNIRQYCWSVRRERSVFTRVVQFPIGENGLFHGPSTDTLPTTKETSYRRGVGIPSTSLIESSGLSSQEFVLGAALVLSRKHKPKKR